MDFTFEKYKSLIAAFQSQHYTFTRFDDRVISGDDSIMDKNIILRHDVDLLPHNALDMAQLERDLGIRGTYYFRIVPESFDARIIEKVAELGHEVGYHYEDVDLVRGDRSKVIGDRLQVEAGGRKSEVRSQRSDIRNQRSEIRGQRSEVGGQESGIRSQEFNGNGEETKPEIQNPKLKNQQPATSNQKPAPDLIDRALELFLTNLEKMRKIVAVKTICMHGSPLSKYDNRLLWTKYDYRDYGIIGEPYFDVDFSQVAYYTDTGRRWDGEAVSVRDKVGSSKYVVGSVGVSEYRGIGEPATGNQQPALSTNFPRFRKTSDIISAIENGYFPEKAMITIHPQRWHDRAVPWVKELVWQNVKNVGKFFLVKSRK